MMLCMYYQHWDQMMRHLNTQQQQQPVTEEILAALEKSWWKYISDAIVKEEQKIEDGEDDVLMSII